MQLCSYSICRLPSSWLRHSHVSSLLLSMIHVSAHTRLFPHVRAAVCRPSLSLQPCTAVHLVSPINRVLCSPDQDINMLPTQSYSIPRLTKSLDPMPKDASSQNIHTTLITRVDQPLDPKRFNNICMMFFKCCSKFIILALF